MLKKLLALTAVLLTALLMTACGKSYDFSQTELTEAMGVKKEVFDKMDANGGDEEENEMMQQAMDMAGVDFYSYSFAHSGSDMEYDTIELTFSGGKVCGVSLSSINLEDFTYAMSDYSVFGIRIGDKIADAEAKAEAQFGEKGKALSEDSQMGILTDGVYDYISYGDFSKKGYMQIVVNREKDAVTKIEYSKY